MPGLQEVQFPSLPLERFTPIIGKRRAQRMREATELARRILGERAIWNVNSTGTGGGVAEILHSLLPYVRGAGLNTHWMVVQGDERFFTITKRIHNRLHGSHGDGGPLGDKERAYYEAVSKTNAEQLCAVVRSGDLVILHDPQTAGLIAPMREAGAAVIWRCHIGLDQRDEIAESTWGFLEPFLDPAHVFIFSRRAYAPSWLDGGRLHVIPPSIGAFSPKNQPMTLSVARAISGYIGLIEAEPENGRPVFKRTDGSPGRVDRHADILHAGRLPRSSTPLIVQVSRWDRLKDMLGVMRCFAEYVDGFKDAHLALVGPNIHGVVDDPEGGLVLDECMAAWRDLTHSVRRRVQIVCLPMADFEENGAIVNAIQRHAAVIVQKSLQEGFGLTVTEAMWKARPVIASAVGGIQDQIVDGKHGILIDDPTDLKACGLAIRRVLGDRALGRRLGRNARRRVAAEFLGPRHLVQYVDIIKTL